MEHERSLCISPEHKPFLHRFGILGIELLVSILGGGPLRSGSSFAGTSSFWSHWSTRSRSTSAFEKLMGSSLLNPIWILGGFLASYDCDGDRQHEQQPRYAAPSQRSHLVKLLHIFFRSIASRSVRDALRISSRAVVSELFSPRTSKGQSSF